MRRIATVLAVVLLISACSGGGNDDGAAPAPLLAGAGNSPATAALASVSAPRAPPADVDGGIILSRVSLVLTADATVANVNDVARTLGATGIAYALTGSPFVTLIVPRQADAGALQQLVDRVRGAAGIIAATPGRQLAGKQLPSDGATTAPAGELDHLLATRFPAAWNAARLALDRCAGHPVTVLVPDVYLDNPLPGFDDQLPGANANFAEVPLLPVSVAQRDPHGYEVALALGGRFDLTAPTGAIPFPECLRIVPDDISGLDHFGAIDEIRAAIEREGDRVIVNGSIGYVVTLCGDHANQPCDVADINDTLAPRFKDEIALRVAAGIAWAAYAMRPDVVDNTLFAVAAGNERNFDPDKGFLGEAYAGLHAAHLASPQGVATVLPDLGSLLADPALWQSTHPNLPDLTLDAAAIGNLQDNVAAAVSDPVTDLNLSLVGSVTNAPDPSVLQIAPESNDGADLLTIGEAVTIDTSPSIIGNGTSFSAPQVAGLAAYLWLLDDSLRAEPVAETLKLIHATARGGAGTNALVDAYAAVLALDARNHGTAVRKAILDVTGDGIFDQQDLEEFIAAYGLDDPNTPTIPSERDYGRFDLNGDGYTGGIPIDAFDLDADGLDANGRPIVTSTDETIEGYPVTFDEAALSDAQILCYYAYSPLYATDQGGPNDQARTQLLGADHCVRARLNVTAPATIATTAPIEVTVTVPQGGSLVPAPNVRVTLTPTCGSVTPASGLTDADGRVTATVTIDPGCGSVSVGIVARASDTSPPLASTSVSLTSERVILDIGSDTGDLLRIFRPFEVTPGVNFEVGCGEQQLPLDVNDPASSIAHYLATGSIEAQGAPCIATGSTFTGPIGAITVKLNVSGTTQQNIVQRLVRAQAVLTLSAPNAATRYQIAIADTVGEPTGSVATRRIVSLLPFGRGEYCVGDPVAPGDTVRAACFGPDGDTLERDFIVEQGTAIQLRITAEVELANNFAVASDALIVTITPQTAP
jgi:hypothetical protein